MQKRTIASHTFVVLNLVLASCGGGAEAAESDGTSEPVAANETAGAETVETPPVEVSAAPDPVPEPSGPVQVTVTLKVGNDDAAGTVAFVNEAGETAAEGAAGEAFTVPSGFYRINATISDAAVLVDTPTVTQEAQLAVGEPQSVEVRFPRARILLNVTRNGRPLRRPEITLFRQGSEEPSATFQVGSEHVPITPGRYEADVAVRGHQIRVRGLTFMDGATQSIPVAIQ